MKLCNEFVYFNIKSLWCFCTVTEEIPLNLSFIIPLNFFLNFFRKQEKQLEKFSNFYNSRSIHFINKSMSSRKSDCHGIFIRFIKEIDNIITMKVINSELAINKFRSTTKFLCLNGVNFIEQMITQQLIIDALK